jgi:hypothetical protein
MRRFNKSVCAVAVVSVAALSLPLHAAALNHIGGGPLTLTLSTTSAGGMPVVGFTCGITMNVAGTGAVAVVSDNGTGSYTGPITVTGMTQTCGEAALESTFISLSITGNPTFGDFSCQSDPGPGVLQREGPAVTMVAPLKCEISGVTQVVNNIIYEAVATPTSVDLTSGGITAETTVGPVVFPAV